jgi:hypothetical protein
VHPLEDFFEVRARDGNIAEADDDVGLAKAVGELFATVRTNDSPFEFFDPSPGLAEFHDEG